MASTTNGNNKTAAKLQSLFDDHKEEIPDGLYLTLCNAMKDLHTQENDKEKKGFYKIHYLYTDMERDSCNEHTMQMIPAEQIVQIDHNEAAIIKDQIDHKGTCSRGTMKEMGLAFYGKRRTIRIEGMEDEDGEEHEQAWHNVTSSTVMYKITKL